MVWLMSPFLALLFMISLCTAEIDLVRFSSLEVYSRSKSAYLSTLLACLDPAVENTGACAGACISARIPVNSSIRNDVSFGEYALTLTPDDPRYDDLRRHTNNLRFVTETGYIVFATNPGEVVAVLQHAVDNNLRPTIRSGAHCLEDFWSNNSNGVLIDLSSMNKIYKSDDGLIWLEPGVTLRQMYRTLYKQWDLVVPGGECIEIGIGGHVLGGGFGYLNRLHGLAIDYVEAFEMVYINEGKKVEVVIVSKNSTIDRDKNLFWGLRGGGNQNFGIVTKIAFSNLPQSPPTVHVYSAMIPMKNMSQSKFISIMDKYTRFLVSNSEVGNQYCDMYMELQPERLGSDIHLGVRMHVFGENKTHLAESFIAHLGLDRSQFTCEEMTYYRAIVMRGFMNDATSDKRAYIDRGSYMVNSFPMNQLRTIWKYMTDSKYDSLSYGTIVLYSYGCAVGRVPENFTAYPHRRPVIASRFGTVWQTGVDSALNYEWSNDFYRSMYGDDGPIVNNFTDGAYANFPDRSLIDWQHLYFKDNYERLQQVKAQWDPLNIFWHRQSIELPK